MTRRRRRPSARPAAPAERRPVDVGRRPRRTPAAAWVIRPSRRSANWSAHTWTSSGTGLDQHLVQPAGADHLRRAARRCRRACPRCAKATPLPPYRNATSCSPKPPSSSSSGRGSRCRRTRRPVIRNPPTMSSRTTRGRPAPRAPTARRSGRSARSRSASATLHHHLALAPRRAAARQPASRTTTQPAWKPRTPSTRQPSSLAEPQVGGHLDVRRPRQRPRRASPSQPGNSTSGSVIPLKKIANALGEDLHALVVEQPERRHGDQEADREADQSAARATLTTNASTPAAPAG